MAGAEAFLWLAGETVPIKTVALGPVIAQAPSAYLPALVGQQFSRFSLREDRFNAAADCRDEQVREALHLDAE